MKNKIVMWVLGVLVAAFGVGVVATPAAAATGCHTFAISVTGNDGFSPTYTVPASSSCADIQINHSTNAAHAARAFQVLFFRSDGSEFFGSTVVVPYNSATWSILATDVLNGTRFSIQQEKAGAEAWTANCKD